jgi:hypothetical protein
MFDRPYFVANPQTLGCLQVQHHGRLWRVADLSRDELLSARAELELALENEQALQALGGEVECRKMLRALRYAIGPNADRNRAMQWRILSILATSVNVSWRDDDGQPQSFASSVPDSADWLQSIRREMGLLSDMVFEKSWGKINIVPCCRHSNTPLSLARIKGIGRHVPSLIGEAPLSIIPLSVFVWVSKDGDGRFPGRKGKAETWKKPVRISETARVLLTGVYTHEERLSRYGGWGSCQHGGLLHEFWHNVQRAVKRLLGYHGCIPSPHNRAHFDMLRAEIRSQGLPEPPVRYDEFLGSWPSWRMCRQLERFASARGNQP